MKIEYVFLRQKCYFLNNFDNLNKVVYAK